MRRSRSGFTLIELVFVVLVIAILASLAIFSLHRARGRALVGTLHSDLRNLAVAQEGHYYQHGAYATNLSQLPVRASEGVSLVVVSATPQGWSGTADHAGALQPHCAIFYGVPASLPAPAVAEGVIACQ